MVQFYSFTCICQIFLTFTICKRDSLLPTAHSFPLCHRLIDHMCKGLFLGSLFYSIDLHVFIFVPVAPCLDYYSFAVYFKIKEKKFIFLFSSSRLFWLFSLLCIHTFLRYFSSFMKNAMHILTYIPLNLYIALSSMIILVVTLLIHQQCVPFHLFLFS